MSVVRHSGSGTVTASQVSPKVECTVRQRVGGSHCQGMSNDVVSGRVGQSLPVRTSLMPTYTLVRRQHFSDGSLLFTLVLWHARSDVNVSVGAVLPMALCCCI